MRFEPIGAILWLLLAAAIPSAEPVVDRVDVAELNRVYDGCGRQTLSQIVWWDRHPDDYHVVAWRLFGERMRPHQERGDWVSRWQDGDTFREVRAASFIETHTQWDVELEDRVYLPKEHRRGLCGERALP